jgi:pyocin large subunit-like protein
MSNKKQTAVEFLEKEYYENDYNIFQENFEQAKAMEKEQHRKTYFDSTSQFANDAHMPYIKLFEQYYNETYGE